jgi:hypothetical protein
VPLSLLVILTFVCCPKTDPMWPDKDEDRGQISLGLPMEPGLFAVPFHDRTLVMTTTHNTHTTLACPDLHDLNQKNVFDDPDEMILPWYRNPIEDRVVPATYLYAGQWLRVLCRSVWCAPCVCSLCMLFPLKTPLSSGVRWARRQLGFVCVAREHVYVHEERQADDRFG